MMVSELSNHGRRSSFSSHSDDSNDESERLKSMMGMGNLLPSLDASMDSHMDYSGQTSTSTTLHTSGALSGSESGAGSSALMDLDDDVEDEILAAHKNMQRRSTVSYQLKKAFSKMSKSKKSASSGSGGGSGGNKKKKKSHKSKSIKLEDDKDDCGCPKQQEEQLAPGRNCDDISLDSTVHGDPPTVCSGTGEMMDESETILAAELRRAKPLTRRKSVRQRRSEPGCAIEKGLDESSGSSRNDHRAAKSRLSTSGRTSSSSRRDEDWKKSRSSRRGGKSSGGGGRRMPPKSKSYSCDREDQERIREAAARGGDSKHHDDRPGAPRRSSSFVGLERQRNASSRNSSVTAQAAIPNPRPSMRGSRHSSMTDRRPSSSTSRRRSGDAPTNRSVSVSKIGDDSALDSGTGHSKTTKRNSIKRSKSFVGKVGDSAHESKSASSSRRPAPPRSKSFEDGMPGLSNMRPPRRRSSSRSKSEKKKANPALSVSGPMVVCRHGEKLGECCYDQASSVAKSSAPLPLFSLEDHFGVEQPSDELSIDTASIDMDSANNRNVYLSTFLVKSNSSGKLNIANKAGEDEAEKQRRQRSKSRSRAHSDSERSRSRSKSTSRSKSRTRREEAEHGESAHRKRSLSRSQRASNDIGKSERGRGPTVVADRDRSQSQRGRRASNTKNRNSDRERSQSKTQRGRPSKSRSISRSQRGGSRRPSISQSKRRPGSRSPSCGPSISQSKRRPGSRSPSCGPSISQSKRRSSSRSQSRSKSRSPSRRPSISESKRGRSKSAARCSQEQQQRERSSSKARRPSAKAQNRAGSTTAARRETNTLKQYETSSKQDASIARRESSSLNLKQYETLSKEDLLPGGGASNRRPRSLSRSRRSDGNVIKSGGTGSLESQLSGHQHTRVSRSLSRTRSNGSGEHLAISDYMKKQQPVRKARTDDETNSQTTGTNSTGSVTYVTPSWMWNAASNPVSSQTSSGKEGPNGASGDFMSASLMSHSYDATAEMETPKSEASDSTWGASASNGSVSKISPPLTNTTTTGSGSNISPPLMNAMNSSMGSLSVSATPATKAKHFYGKIMKQEREQIRIQSQQLFQNMNAVPQPATPQSMFASMH